MVELKILLLTLLLGLSSFGFCQTMSDADFDELDSLIMATPQIDICLINGKEDERFIYRTPEKLTDYKQVFTQASKDVFVFDSSSHFTCLLEVEVNCKGMAGNYSFGIEPRTFTNNDFRNFKQLISIVETLRKNVFKPASHLGELVNSRLKFKINAKLGLLQIH